MDFLKGYRTYIIAAAIAALTVAKYLGYVTEATYQEALAFLGAGGLVTLRAAQRS